MSVDAQNVYWMGAKSHGLFGGTLTKISDVFMLPSPYHPETDLRNRNGPGILINLGSVEAAKDAEILPPHQQA